MKQYKNPLSVRGDCLYCPLPLAVDSYWNCLTDCHHCYFRRLNRTWGTDLRPADTDALRRRLQNGFKNRHPTSHLACALSLKLTIRVGNKTDPYQEVEKKHRITKEILGHLEQLKWSYAIQTRFLSNMMELDENRLASCHEKGLLSIISIISPGLENDWKILERGRTTPIDERFSILHKIVKRGWNVGVNGEPFIPGYHTIKDFRETLKRLKAAGVNSYNTYNFHFNDYVAKRLHSIGIDIEKIWFMNQNENWKPIQRRLCEIAQHMDIRLGCPDFVNTGKDWIEGANTCCGINVPQPSTYNTHFWKKQLQQGADKKSILALTYQGIGDEDLAQKIMDGKPCDNYTMKDAGMI